MLKIMGIAVCVVLVLPLVVNVVMFLLGYWYVGAIALGVAGAAVAAYFIWLERYLRSEEFEMLAEEVQGHIEDCHVLAEHIEELKGAYAEIAIVSRGVSKLTDDSYYVYNRAEWANIEKVGHVYNCSAAVVKNAHLQPLKYFCKYFEVPITEKSLERLEHTLNSFLAVEQGKEILYSELISLMAKVNSTVPFMFRRFQSPKIYLRLGLKPMRFAEPYYPVYSFCYVSPGGNSSTRCDITLDVRNLEELVEYIGAQLTFRHSVEGQRALMTARLREFIKTRDNHTCQLCALSIRDEPNLLLEVDHKVPLSKGGLSTIENLQTLCWRCNRSKGAKLFPL